MFEWSTNDDLSTSEVEGIRLEVWAEHRSDSAVFVWDIFVWCAVENDWYHHDSGSEATIDEAKLAAEKALTGDDEAYGDDMDGDHGTALMSAGYGDEAYGYECGEWL